MTNCFELMECRRIEGKRKRGWLGLRGCDEFTPSFHPVRASVGRGAVNNVSASKKPVSRSRVSNLFIIINPFCAITLGVQQVWTRSIKEAAIFAAAGISSKRFEGRSIQAYTYRGRRRKARRAHPRLLARLSGRVVLREEERTKEPPVKWPSGPELRSN